VCDDVAAIKSALAPYGIERHALDAIVTLVLLHATSRPAPGPTISPISLGDVARIFHRSSLKRRELVGRAADDPAWNMLLAIFADQSDDVAVSVSSACYASGGPPTTALRHLAMLHDQGILARTADPLDRRRANVSLSAAAYSKMATLISSFCVKPPECSLEVAAR
jgi:hypothetical protein